MPDDLHPPPVITDPATGYRMTLTRHENGQAVYQADFGPVFLYLRAERAIKYAERD